MRDRFRAGDPAALGEAYDEHAQVLHRYALRVCGDRAAAEDVVSAAFLEAWRCRGRLLPDGGSLRPWLLGITTNILRGQARETRRRDAAFARLADRGVLPDFTDDVVTRLSDAERLHAARTALTRLRRRDREVFALVVWAGLDYAAAAEALDIPVGTVRSRLSRARDRLRTLAEAELRARYRTGARGAPGVPRGGGSDSAGASHSSTVGHSKNSEGRALPARAAPATAAAAHAPPAEAAGGRASVPVGPAAVAGSRPAPAAANAPPTPTPVPARRDAQSSPPSPPSRQSSPPSPPVRSVTPTPPPPLPADPPRRARCEVPRR
ncbi:RNA polymerase sigma factor [Streptomyces sp. NPDC048018]|uniref:RNA polymerase sigma factor n=1 Tax=Streptomyces sp. NPDC048018 TaxID=3365499 RepID=UPI00371CE92F